jgi:hypothetical protein
MAEWVEIRKIIQEMEGTDEIDSGTLTIINGEFEVQRLEPFLKAWELPREGMPWALWQWTDDIRITYEESMPEDLDYLERGRIFGKVGDLALRRDGARLYWQYIGESEGVPVELSADYGGTDYWDIHEEGWKLRPYERTALLWGEYVPELGHWYEDRVGWARLVYPTLEDSARVQARYVEYLRGGDVELVRLVGLEPHTKQMAGGQ